jgi:hypothetical protein
MNLAVVQYIQKKIIHIILYSVENVTNSCLTRLTNFLTNILYWYMKKNKEITCGDKVLVGEAWMVHVVNTAG